MDFYTAWTFLNNHKMFNGLFCHGLWTEVVKVNPTTNTIDADQTKNTKVQVWLEHGPYEHYHNDTTHDIYLDCGGDTFEDAIISLAERVKYYYNDDGSYKDLEVKTMEYGFLSLVPPLLTIVLALVTKNVFVSLFIGIMTGSFVLNAFAPLASFNAGIYAIVDSMSQGNTIIIGSCLIVGAVIHLMEKAGGIEGFVNVVVKSKGYIKTKRGANLFTWLLGLAIFTSGSLSCMVTGAVSRPVNDALKVPHEKAAFLVHTTSTPWCVLFPFSGWLASMAGYLVSGGVSEAESVSVLFQSLGFNFYCIMAIAMCLLVSVLQKDIGPMAAAEKRAAETGLLDDPSHGAKEEVEAATSGAKPRACNLLAPIGVLIVVMFATLFVTGNGDITQGAGMQALIWAVVCALLTILVMVCVQKVFTVE